MPIQISNAIVKPNTSKNGQTDDFEISFDGHDIFGPTSIGITFTISPFNKLNFAGNQTTKGDFTLPRASKSFSITFSITNDPQVGSGNGSIDLLAINKNDPNDTCNIGAVILYT